MRYQARPPSAIRGGDGPDYQGQPAGLREPGHVVEIVRGRLGDGGLGRGLGGLARVAGSLGRSLAGGFRAVAGGLGRSLDGGLARVAGSLGLCRDLGLRCRCSFGLGRRCRRGLGGRCGRGFRGRLGLGSGRRRRLGLRRGGGLGLRRRLGFRCRLGLRHGLGLRCGLDLHRRRDGLHRRGVGGEGRVRIFGRAQRGPRVLFHGRGRRRRRHGVAGRAARPVGHLRRGRTRCGARRRAGPARRRDGARGRRRCGRRGGRRARRGSCHRLGRRGGGRRDWGARLRREHRRGADDDVAVGVRVRVGALGDDRVLRQIVGDRVRPVRIGGRPGGGGSIECARPPWSPGTTSSMAAGGAAGTRRPSK